ncbi:hypothetical protein BCON_0194g00110 [Botryotinia convoluta]|uniref:Uncharacterized protein n=1 Tax=Botryotinia convoluta TaxID=54673 RepID=A0A4Z1HMX6_9HELO|nr:hypothetical protein BCON_0194g00110 [Botryotinia convoluta]
MKFKVGERVTGLAAVFYNGEIDHGAWQSHTMLSHTMLREIATTNISDDLSFEDASTFSMAMATVAVGFYLLLDFPRMLGKGRRKVKGFHLGKVRHGIKKHPEYFKSIGATATFDYRDPKVVRNIIGEVSASDVDLTIGSDAITENDTPQLSADGLSATGHGKGKLVLTLPWPEEYPKPEDVEIFKAVAARLGTDDQDVGAWFFNDFLTDALEKKYVVTAPPVEIVEGGIASAQKGFDILKEGCQ